MQPKDKVKLRGVLAAAMMAAFAYGLSARPALAASKSEIDRNTTQALTTLYQTTPGAEALADKSRGILIFPSIVKGGLIVGAEYGDGALRKSGKTVGYYRTISG